MQTPMRLSFRGVPDKPIPSGIGYSMISSKRMNNTENSFHLFFKFSRICLTGKNIHQRKHSTHRKYKPRRYSEHDFESSIYFLIWILICKSNKHQRECLLFYKTKQD